ncbi:sialate O-acetylesterase [Belliella aquatica]|uniref:9-O-acetylesterase n=2 Tax=Belliella aquatica TaxID=1323734 RepID=A0ABQ1MIE8_9BACT|nr:9-O-acetylesterase [Belliella aquatica]
MIFILILGLGKECLAEIRLPVLISDGMVLQRNVPISIWGWGDANKIIKIDFNGINLAKKINEDGTWELILPSMEAGGPFLMKISTSDETVEVKDIWIGDVWLCSGQSNMETTMERVEPMFPEEFISVNKPQIRYFDVPDDYTFTEVKSDLKGGKWKELNEENIRSYAAVAYFFAKNINGKYSVPVGMINASVGGSPIQSWLREEDLKQFPKDYEEVLYFQKPGVIEKIEKTDRDKINQWRQELLSKDLGLTNLDSPWFSPEFQPNDWEEMNSLDLLPLENSRPVNGVYWFRKEIHLDFDPADYTNVKLLLGTLVDSDEAYLNGVSVGNTGYRYPPRRYNVPAGVLKMGKNILTLRIVSERGPGGFITEKPYQLEIGDQIIDLNNRWEYKIGAKMPEAPSQTSIRFKPMGLYNAMIAPLHNFQIKGILWYQGESNVVEAKVYAKQFAALIEGWRDEWKRPKLPFLYVQLPNFMEVSSEPQESGWAEMRETQRKSLEISNTGMAITIDVGEANDIHPLDKKSVGDRLALQAQKLVYGEKIGPFSGPLFEKAKVQKGKLFLTFKETGKGLSTSDSESLSGFAIAKEGGEFQWIPAIIKEHKVIIDLQGFDTPGKLRYAWANNPKSANLINSAGLPASPFEIELK